MAQLGRKEAERLIKKILTEYARKIRSAKKREYAEDIQQQLFNPKIDAFYKLAKSEDMDFYIFNRLNDEGIRQLLVGCRRLAKCYELDSYGKIKDFTYEPETSKCRIASDSDGKYSAGGSYTFTVEGKAELGNKWYEPHSIAWHFYRENPGTGKYEETASKMDEARALADFDTWDRSFLVSEKGRYKVTATIFNQAITTGIRPDIVEVCELYFEAEERNIAALSCSDKIRIAMEYSNVIDEIREEIGDINILVTQMVIVSSFLIGLALTGYGAVAEALGFVLLAAGAAMSGTQLLAGVIELVKFFTTVDDAKTEDDLKVCGKIFGDAVAKIGVDGLFFFLSMFGLKKASARLTTRTVIDNGLNSKKWAGKQIEEKELNLEVKNNYSWKVGYEADKNYLGNGKIGDFSNLQGKSIEEVLTRIPKNATRRELIPEAGKVTEGFEYKWITNGKTYRARIHGIDGSAPKGSNASKGWVLRIQEGKKYLDPITLEYQRPGITNIDSPYYNEELANRTHIPIKTPRN